MTYGVEKLKFDNSNFNNPNEYFFLPATFNTLLSLGEPKGYRLLFLLISFPIHLLLISAGLTFKRKFQSNSLVLKINSVGLIWSLSWLFLLMTAMH